MHAVSDLFECCTMTHGDQNGLYLSGYDPHRRMGEQVRVERLLECFDARHCPALQHKPKLFFIQVVNKFTESELSVVTESSLSVNLSTGRCLPPAGGRLKHVNHFIVFKCLCMSTMNNLRKSRILNIMHSLAN